MAERTRLLSSDRNPMEPLVRADGGAAGSTDRVPRARAGMQSRAACCCNLPFRRARLSRSRIKTGASSLATF